MSSKKSGASRRREIVAKRVEQFNSYLPRSKDWWPCPEEDDEALYKLFGEKIGAHLSGATGVRGVLPLGIILVQGDVLDQKAFFAKALAVAQVILLEKQSAPKGSGVVSNEIRITTQSGEKMVMFVIFAANHPDDLATLQRTLDANDRGGKWVCPKEVLPDVPTLLMRSGLSEEDAKVVLEEMRK